MKSRTSTRALLGASCATLFYAAPAFADVTVANDSETALATSTNGDVTIAEDVTLDVEGSDPLILDSNNTVTISDGAIVNADDADGRNGILVASGTDGTIINGGSILVTEDFVADDDDGNSTPDGPVAEASGRIGILVNSTSGSIENSGIIYVEGLDSAGIQLADGWAGNFDNTGSISVLGDGSIGVSTGDIATDFSLGGTVTSVGAGSQVFVVGGDVNGRLVIDGALTKGRSYTNDDGGSYILSRSQLREASPAVQITGNVSGGILLDAPPLDLDADVDDEDGDGIDDADETTGSITTYGESPALVIGGSEAITVGAGETRDGTFSLGIDGTISAQGSYSTFDATGVVIGGQGGTVTLTDGISIGGTVAATTPDSSALALLINEGATVTSLSVSGTIRATITSQGEGSAVAIRDLSGTLTTIDNSGYITVSGASEDETVALDLSRNTSGVTINQHLNDVDAAFYAAELEDEDYDPDSPTIYSRITGDILTGSGNDSLSASTGIINGDTYLGAGDDSIRLSGNANYFGSVYAQAGDFVMSLADTAQFSGTLDAASNAALLTLSDDAFFSGTMANAEQLSVAVNGGTLQAPDGQTVSFDSLSVGADGAIGIVINTEDGTSSNFEVANATFASGSSVNVEIDNIIGADGSYVVLTADTLSGQESLDLGAGDLPLIYSANLTSTDNQILIDISQQTAEQLGLAAPQAAAYEAILQTAAEDSFLEASILQASDVAALSTQFEQLLPEFEGGVFDFVTRSSRLATRRLSDGIGEFPEWPVGIWLEPFAFRGSNDSSFGEGYSLSGWGLSGGWERRLGDHHLGLSGSWTSGSVDTGDYRSIGISKYEVGAHWNVRAGGFYGFVRLGYFWTNMDVEGTFTGTIDDTDFTYANASSWGGSGYTGMLGGSYDLPVFNRLTIRPKVMLDYYKFDEESYETSADSDALALSVDNRTSDLTSLTPSLVTSFRLGNQKTTENPLTVEFEGGYRSLLAGQVGSVSAAFEAGDSFTLLPSSLDGGWTAEARIKGGAWDHAWQIGVGAEQAGGDVDLSARASLNIAF